MKYMNEPEVFACQVTGFAGRPFVSIVRYHSAPSSDDKHSIPMLFNRNIGLGGADLSEAERQKRVRLRPKTDLKIISRSGTTAITRANLAFKPSGLTEIPPKTVSFSGFCGSQNMTSEARGIVNRLLVALNASP